jgi:glycosyltransferase involved in cell wall biosynthesis
VTRTILVTPGLGGADGVSELTRQWVEALAARAAERGGHVEVWSLADAARPAALPANATFRTAAGSRWRFASLVLAAGPVDASTLVAVMHVHLLPALLPLMWRGARVVCVMLGIEVWKPLPPLQRIALGRCWKVAAISAHTVDRFRRENPTLGALPVAVLHPRAPADVRPADEVTPGPFALIVGRMSSQERYKGHDALIDVWPRVLGEVPDARLIVAGTGDDLDRLRGRVQAAGLADRVIFTGAVPGDRLAALYRDAALFVMPSEGEGFGIVYLEAMRAGTPCVAGPGAAAEIITDGVDGLIVDPADGDAVARAVVRLFVDPELRRRLGAAAARRVFAEFTPERFSVRLSALLFPPC